MQFIDERIVFDFNTIISNWGEGIYRYDVLLDNEIIFIGNLYCEATPPKIDVTDILRNFYKSEYDFSWVLSDAKIIREVTVNLYNKQQTDEESMTDKVCFIYRQPNYNSLVTTPIIDVEAEGIGSMLMLQGCDYFTNTAYFLPTYPKIDSNNFTVDIVWARQSSELKHQCDLVYSNGVIAKDVLSRDFYDGGVQKFACPLNVILKDYSAIENAPYDTRGFLSSRDINWRVGYVDKNGVDVMVATNTIGNNSSQAITSLDIVFESEAGATYSLTPIINEEQTTYFEIHNFSVLKDSTYFTIKPKQSNGSYSSEELKINLNTSIRDNLLSNGNFKIIISAISNISTYQVKITISVEALQERTATICDIDRLDVVTSSLENPTEQYTCTALKFDSNSRYFLKWRDRYGMPQCQPFKGTHTYGEKTTKSNITNYQNIKKLSGVDVVSSWKLNTDWIKEEFYPFYESIFVSPWLQLYDAKEDKVYSVILTDTDYTEKTFKNQNRSLFNLQLEVELDKSQNIIY